MNLVPTLEGVTSEATGRRKPVATLVGLLDVVVILLAIVLAAILRFGDTVDRTVAGAGTVDYVYFSVVLGICWIAGLHIAQCYHHELFGLGSEEYRRVARATFGVFGAIAIAALLFRVDIARGYLAIAFPLGLAALLLERLLVRRWVVRQRLGGVLCDRALIVGTPVEVRHVAAGIAQNPSAGYRTAAVSVIGEPDPVFELSDGTEVDNLPAIDDVRRLDGRIDTLIIAGQSAISRTQLRSIGWQLEESDIQLALASQMTDVAGPRIHRRPIEGLPLMSVESPTYSGTKFIVKRVVDIVLSGMALLLLSPVFLIVSVLIYLEDRGPVLFRQIRVGAGGALFRITKFRSMCIDAEARLAEFEGSGTPVWKLKDDPRITRIGKFIRTYSLDELPQLFDVLIGHMSLVGPRPQQPSEVETYEEHVHRRLNVKPGVTGPWQVGGRSNLTWEQTIQKDLYYVENWSLTGDLAIMLKTVRAVAAKDGAY
ncbi:sugar transferase [Flexivirga sp. B27]